MGHELFGLLPSTVDWRAVVAALQYGAPADEIAVRSADAIEKPLEDAPNYPVHQGVMVDGATLARLAPGAAIRRLQARRIASAFLLSPLSLLPATHVLAGEPLSEGIG